MCHRLFSLAFEQFLDLNHNRGPIDINAAIKLRFNIRFDIVPIGCVPLFELAIVVNAHFVELFLGRDTETRQFRQIITIFDGCIEEV